MASQPLVNPLFQHCTERDPLSIVEIFTKIQCPPKQPVRSKHAASSNNLSPRDFQRSARKASDSERKRKISFKKGDVETDEDIPDHAH